MTPRKKTDAEVLADAITAAGEQAATTQLQVTQKRPLFTDRRLGLLIAFLALVVGAMAATTTASLRQSRSNGELLDNSTEVIEIIKDSVDPGGKRFKRGQAQTAAVVGQLNDVTVIAAYCGHQFKTLPEVRSCVASEFSKAITTTTTQP